MKKKILSTLCVLTVVLSVLTKDALAGFSLSEIIDQLQGDAILVQGQKVSNSTVLALVWHSPFYLVVLGHPEDTGFTFEREDILEVLDEKFETVWKKSSVKELAKGH